MPPELALCGCIGFILLLFAQDLNRREGISKALWIPFVWVVILGSRPISTWFGGAPTVSADISLDGSPVDRMVFLALIVAGVVVLRRRRVDWSLVFASNVLLCIYFLYFGTSVLWSDYSFVAFKRWIKDFGNVIMVLIILTEVNPIEAAQAVFVRSAFMLVPFSVLFVKYYPGLGRYYDRWEGRPTITGVSGDKNLLGLTLFVCGVFLFWNLIEMFKEESRAANKGRIVGCLILITMTCWLLLEAHSATALACSIFCVGLFLAIKLQKVRTATRLFATGGFIAVVFLLTWMAGVDWVGMSAQALGRDPTLTGRSDIWQSVLHEDVNPIVGTGFYSFWMGNRSEKLSEKYYYYLNEAHNGYIETYLNGGLIGVVLLVGLLISAGRKIGHYLENHYDDYGPLRLAFFATAALYNMTESLFNRLDLVWVALLLVAMEYPHPESEIESDVTDDATGETELDVADMKDARA